MGRLTIFNRLKRAFRYLAKQIKNEESINFIIFFLLLSVDTHNKQA